MSDAIATEPDLAEPASLELWSPSDDALAGRLLQIPALEILPSAYARAALRPAWLSKEMLTTEGEPGAGRREQGILLAKSIS